MTGARPSASPSPLDQGMAYLRAEAIKQGMTPMYEDGMRKALAGVTTFEEVLRVTRED